MVYTWKENRVLESVDRPRLKMLCEINGIKITEADIKDSLRSVPSKVGDMDGIKQRKVLVLDVYSFNDLDSLRMYSIRICRFVTFMEGVVPANRSLCNG